MKTGVEIAGLEHIEYLPIMDYKNKSINLENVTSFDVNKTIQRSLTKALARHGLGLYLYSGEDLPEIETEKISIKDAKILQNVVKNFNEPDKLYATLLRRYNVSSFRELTVKQRIEILEGTEWLAARPRPVGEIGALTSRKRHRALRTGVSSTTMPLTGKP